MKTKSEILADRFILNSTRGEIVFNNGTPIACAKKIVSIIENGERITLDYGDIETNVSWNEEFDINGYIGLSKGYHDLKYPILVHNKSSSGGGTILTDCILKIMQSKGKKVIYQNQ